MYGLRSQPLELISLVQEGAPTNARGMLPAHLKLSAGWAGREAAVAHNCCMGKCVLVVIYVPEALGATCQTSQGFST